MKNKKKKQFQSISFRSQDISAWKQTLDSYSITKFGRFGFSSAKLSCWLTQLHSVDYEIKTRCGFSSLPTLVWLVFCEFSPWFVEKSEREKNIVNEVGIRTNEIAMMPRMKMKEELEWNTYRESNKCYLFKRISKNRSSCSTINSLPSNFVVTWSEWGWSNNFHRI